MSKWQFTKGLHDIGNGCYAYLQPDGSWGWSNAGLIVDGDDCLLVDTLFDLPSTGAMLAEMKSSVPASRRIRQLVNTHANGDHTFGNQLVEGAEIIACRACAEEYAETPPERMIQRARNWQNLGVGGAFAQELMWSRFDYRGVVSTPPTKLFEKSMDVKVGDTVVSLTHLGSAHTRGDILVHLRDKKILYTGDLLFVGGHPVIWDGPIDNWIRICQHILDDLDVDVIVPGHGAIAEKAQVREMRDYLVFIRDEARRYYEAGLPYDEAAQKVNFGEFSGWLDPERIVINFASLYREFSGSTAHLDRMVLFEQMKRYREARVAAGHGPHCHHG
ncbi:MAG: MBL fold metallo-hydrolase [Pseudolabrys sp.]|nr:MBL fold metallo-hydrolase [Pseudolabrys sp.]